MALFQYICREISNFADFVRDLPDWYKEEQDYGIAVYLLDFAVSLLESGRRTEFVQLMDVVERGFGESDAIGTALCIDFIQRITDLGELKADFYSHMGPASRACYVDYLRSSY